IYACRETDNLRTNTVDFSSHPTETSLAEGFSAAPAYVSTGLHSTDPQIDRPFSHEAPAETTKRALHLPDTPRDVCSKYDETEPPPAYSEGPSPLPSFTFVMATAGGASSIITQVQQGGPPVNAIGDVGADETITMDLRYAFFYPVARHRPVTDQSIRGTRFVLSRDELLTLPEFVLLSLFPNGLFPEGQMGGFADGDAVQVDYDPVSLQYMLDFFRNVAQSIPMESSPNASQDGDAVPLEPLGSRDDASRRAGIIVLREDLDFYVIPPRPDVGQLEMIEIKRAAAKALLSQGGIFSGLKRSDEPGTTEAHLIEMLTAGYVHHATACCVILADRKAAGLIMMIHGVTGRESPTRRWGSEMGSNAVGMAQKLLLFWRKPARRCWWEGVELEDVEGVEGKLKVWIRRVWTLEMSVIGLR
ncbi:hypothetical protein VDGL01_08247, partial [Verticillium dahliae]